MSEKNRRTAARKRPRAAKRTPRTNRNNAAPPPVIKAMGPLSAEAERELLDKMFPASPLDGMLKLLTDVFPLALAKIQRDLDKPAEQTNHEHVRAQVARALRAEIEYSQQNSSSSLVLDDQAARMFATILDPAPAATA